MQTMKYWQKYIQNVNTRQKMLLASVFGVKCCHASLQCRVFFNIITTFKALQAFDWDTPRCRL